MPAKKRSTTTDPAITSTSEGVAPDSLGSVPAQKKSASKRVASSAAGSEKPLTVKKAPARKVKRALESDVVAPKGASTRRAKSAKGGDEGAGETVAPAAPVSESVLLIDDLTIAVARAATTAEEETTTARVVTEDMIRQRAFYLSLERGRPGDPVADWLEAERSLRRHFA